MLSGDVTGFVLFLELTGLAGRITFFKPDGFQGQEVLEHDQAFFARSAIAPLFRPRA